MHFALIRINELLFVFQIFIRCFGGVRVYDGGGGIIWNGTELYLNGGTVPIGHVLILI